MLTVLPPYLIHYGTLVIFCEVYRSPPVTALLNAVFIHSKLLLWFSNVDLNVSYHIFCYMKNNKNL